MSLSGPAAVAPPSDNASAEVISKGERARGATVEAISSSEKIALGILLLAGLTTWLAVRHWTGSILEDALITYKYAVNLAAGVGFAYNSGEIVQGTTTPLHTILCALICKLAGANALMAVNAAFMAIAGAAAGGFTYVAMRDAGTGRRAASVALVVFFLHPLILSHAIGGMETPLVILFMASSWWAVGRKRIVLAAALCSLLALTRIDSLAWTGILVVQVARTSRRDAALIAVVALAVTAAWLGFAVWLFGSALPHSAIAKRVIQPDSSLVARAAAWGRMGATGMSAGFRALPAAGLALFVIGVGRIIAERSRKALDPVVVYAVVFPVALFVVSAPTFSWYVTPVGWASIVVAAQALDFEGVVTPRLRFLSARPVVVLVALGVIVAGSLAVLPRSVRGMRIDQENNDGFRAEVGRWLAVTSPRGASVAMEAIGYEGFYCNRRVIDLAGLISPEVVKVRQESRSNAEAFERLLLVLRPDYLVLRSFEVDENHHFHGGPLFANGAERAYFDENYREARRFHAPHAAEWGTEADLTVYSRATPQAAP